MISMRNWLRDHPWIGTAFVAGVLAGMVMCLPLVPYKLPDSIANLLGAALGAALAVWGAAWISEHKERQKLTAAKEVLRQVLDPVSKLTDTLIYDLEAVREAPSPEAYGRIRKASTVLSRATQVFEERMEDLQPALVQLGGPGLLCGMNLRRYARSLHGIADLCSSLHQSAGSTLEGKARDYRNRLLGIEQSMRDEVSALR
jgi:hypothetical protein